LDAHGRRAAGVVNSAVNDFEAAAEFVEPNLKIDVARASPSLQDARSPFDVENAVWRDPGDDGENPAVVAGNAARGKVFPVRKYCIPETCAGQAGVVARDVAVVELDVPVRTDVYVGTIDLVVEEGERHEDSRDAVVAVVTCVINPRHDRCAR